MKRIFRYFFYFLIFLIVAGGVTYFVMDKKLPAGKAGPEAEALADKMLAAINIEAWNEIDFIAWDFPRGHHFMWDRKRDLVEVKWDGHRALIDPEAGTGIAYEGEKKADADAQKTLVTKAIHLFWNDSFWLIAFTKVKDPGTVRKIVDLEDGKQGLLVNYATGGTTPGDNYLWLLDANGRPYAWQLWVNLIPIGGLEFTWEDWYPLSNGAMVAPTHKGPFFSIALLNIKIGKSLKEMGRDSDIFAEILN